MRKSQIPARALLAATFWTLFAGALIVLIVVVCGLTLRGALLVAIAATLMLPLAIRNVRGGLDLFEPAVTANFAMGIMFVGRPLGDLITGETIHLGYDVLPTFDEALLVALVGVAAFQLGYLRACGGALARHFPKPPPLRPRMAWLAGLGLSGARNNLVLPVSGWAGRCRLAVGVAEGAGRNRQ